MHLATHHVAELDVTARDLEAHGEDRAILGWVVQAPPGISVGTFFQLRLLALRLELLRRAVAAIRPALFDQARRLFAVRVETLRLAVRLLGSALFRNLLPIQTEPAH